MTFLTFSRWVDPRDPPFHFGDFRRLDRPQSLLKGVFTNRESGSAACCELRELRDAMMITTDGIFSFGLPKPVFEKTVTRQA